MRNQVSNLEYKKRQYNRPRFADGQEMPILESGSTFYLPDELEAIAKNRGYKHGIQPYEQFLYDSYWATRDPDSRILVSVAGEVAQWFSAENDYGGGYKILAQEYKQEYDPKQQELLDQILFEVNQPRDSIELRSKVVELFNLQASNQKYLWVYLRDDPEFPTRGSLHQLHKVVAEQHCDISAQIVTQASDDQFRIVGSLQTEHLDCRKDNNSIHNLRHTTNFINQRMRGESYENKLLEYAKHKPIGKLWECRELLVEMSVSKPTNVIQQ